MYDHVNYKDSYSRNFENLAYACQYKIASGKREGLFINPTALKMAELYGVLAVLKPTALKIGALNRINKVNTWAFNRIYMVNTEF